MANETATAKDQWAKSREYLARSRRSLAGGVSSPFRAMAPVPLYLAGGRGSRIQDVDGNQYIDYVLAWGPLILGHRHPKLVEAVRRQAEWLHICGAQHELEFQVAERVQQAVPCAERVTFTSSGSEAVQLALRLARAFTGRNLMIKFEGHYHGWMDSALLSYHPSAAELWESGASRARPGSRGQVPNAAENVLVVPWNDPEALERVFEERGNEVAGVIAEPVLCNSGCLLPEPGQLPAMARLSRKYGALVIFDEIITGFRLALGGAQSFYGITPDLCTLGKALGGGLPLSAVCGRRDVLELMYGGGVSFGGTFNGNPISLGAAYATLEELADPEARLLARANLTGERLMHGIRAAAARHGIPLCVTGFGTAFALHFRTRPEPRHYRDTLDDDPGMLKRFLVEALAEGIHLLPDGRMYVSAMHTEQDASETVEALERVFRRIETGPASGV